MIEHDGRHARLRYAATGALAAFAAAGAIAATGAFAAKPSTKAPAAPHKTHAQASSAPGATHGSPQQLFLNAVQRLVSAGTITAAQGRTVDHEILAGTFDTDTLASSGFTETQLQAVQQALANTKRALAQTVR
jgi:hypothetical protein